MGSKSNTREAFSEVLLDLIKEGKDPIVVCADTLNSLRLGLLAEKFPNRIVNVGIAEQNMMMVAAGIASTGKIAFAASFAMLNSMRALEQARTFIAYPKLNVKIISGTSGLTGSIDGVTHQSIEDLAIMRSIPNMVVLAPADFASTKVIVRKAVEYIGPVYIRIGREDSPDIFNDDYFFKIGKANKLQDGKDVCIISAGLILDHTLKAVEVLHNRGYSIRLLEMPSIKPIDKDAIIKAAQEIGKLVTVEDHNVLGGLGGAVAEVLTDSFPARLTRLGINDVFAESADYIELLNRYGLSVENIAKQIEKLILE